MREHQTDTSAERTLHSLLVQDRHNDDASFASHQEPLVQLANRVPSGDQAARSGLVSEGALFRNRGRE